MRNNFRKPALFLISLVVVVLTACQGDEVCEDQSSNELRIRFYTLGAEDNATISIDSLIIFGVGQDDKLIYDGSDAVSLAALPMDPGADSCGFVFVAGEQADTLWLTYRRELHFISAECGFTMFFNILDKDYSTNIFEAIEVSNPLVSNIFDEHIKVFVLVTDPDE